MTRLPRLLLFVLAIPAMLLATTPTASAQTFHAIHAFNGTDGANPYTSLVQGRDGYLYGTTIDGGVNGAGNVFRMTPGGKVTSLYDFCSQPNCVDGQYPVTNLIQGANGNFYGTTQSGGTYTYGTVFEITASGALTVLHSFNGNDDGANPYGSLMLASNGDFYGSNAVGGAYGAGTLFTITPSGAVTTLYNFCSKLQCSDGQFPAGHLLQGSDGNLYGVTHAGGSYTNCDVDGCGTVFKMTLSGKLTTLHTFEAIDGEYPYGGLIQNANGFFYGTTSAGGAANDGTIFTVDASGNFNLLYSFNGPDGISPYSMMQGSDGNFYGVTLYGGTKFVRGSIFECTPDGTLTNLHTFDGRHGKNPYGLMQDTDGTFYGTAYFGGAPNDGIVFSLSNGLAPFIQTQPASGNVGMSVTILGTNLKGATAVSFNGTPAQFTVASNSEILTNVPAGARSGMVTVTTASGGTLESNVAFRVTK